MWRSYKVMKVLLINKFLYARGGGAISTLNTGRLLSAKSHKVIYWGMEHPSNPAYPNEELFVSHVDLNMPGSIKEKIMITLNILYSLEAKKKIEKLVKRERPDVVHLNNFAHQISPSILDVFKKYDIPVVMTIRDYKLVCPSYTMLLHGQPCERCRDKKFYWCFISKCTKDSRVKSFINMLEMYLHHRLLRIYDSIDTYISPSLFLKKKLEDMGFNRKIIHLPNFVEDNGTALPHKTKVNTVLYFGRLSPEKGIKTLIQAGRGLDIKLRILGTGPYEDALKQYVKTEHIRNVFFLGYKAGNELTAEIRNALVVVVPSEWYENNPRTVLEAFSFGTPVIGANIGGIPELVLNNETGLVFEPGDIDDLKEKLIYCINNKGELFQMGKTAQGFVRGNFNSAQYYDRLMKIYRGVRG
jgi:glycosyltransferase involved in cell wall biosynthesis